MAITYKWSINQMNAHIQAEGEQNVIFTVHWTYSGSEEVSGKTYQANSIGAESFTYVAGEPFVPYANTEAFEAIVDPVFAFTVVIAVFKKQRVSNTATTVKLTMVGN